jgi:hypothetical protein
MATRRTRNAQLRLVAAGLILFCVQHAHAGRPMATDDTSTLARGECQFEVWGQRADAVREQVIAPACGISDSVELDTAASRIQGSGTTVDGLGAGLKWVPTNATYETTLGTFGWGAEAAVFWARDPQRGWRGDSVALVALTSLALAPEWNIYANFIATRSLPDGTYGSGARVALAWQPDPRWLLFTEGLVTRHSKTLANAGLRFWAVPDILGLDIVASRSGSGDVSLSIGLGWYGIGLP